MFTGRADGAVSCEHFSTL